jgi:hypothetical protein
MSNTVHNLPVLAREKKYRKSGGCSGRKLEERGREGALARTRSEGDIFVDHVLKPKDFQLCKQSRSQDQILLVRAVECHIYCHGLVTDFDSHAHEPRRRFPPVDVISLLSGVKVLDLEPLRAAPLHEIRREGSDSAGVVVDAR